MKPFTTLSEALQWVYDLQKFGIKFGLSSTARLLAALGNPQERLRCLHIAGTNGKGSVAAMLSAIFTAAGYPVGFYSSPHLVRFTERFRFRDADISEPAVLDLINAVCQVVDDREPPTFFEFVTAMAFLHYARQQADPVILETGLGGRLDATNIVTPLVSVITNIGRDHEDYLGRGLMNIAREKAGIIKAGAPVVTYATQKSVIDLFTQTCQAATVPLYLGGRDFAARGLGSGRFHFSGLGHTLENLTTNLLGRHQYRNAAIVLAVIALLAQFGVTVTEAAVRRGLHHTRWPGRLEQVAQNPRIILDGAHNPAAAAALAATLKKGLPHRRLILVLGIMADKNIDAILNCLTPLAHVVIFSRPGYIRAAPGAQLAAQATAYQGEKYIIENLPDAIAKARSLAAAEDLIVITGSLFTVGEARQCLGLETTAGLVDQPAPHPVPH